jgi:hypothetical protein
MGGKFRVEFIAIFLFPKHPDKLWGPLLYSTSTGGTFPGGKPAKV